MRPGWLNTTYRNPSGPLTTSRTRPDVLDQDLLLHDLVAFEDEAPQLLERECGQEQVVLPSRQLVAGVEGDRAGGERRRPLHHRLLHTRLLGLVGNRGAVVVDAVGDDGPAVVVAALDAVQLVAAPRAVLGCPEVAGHRVPGHSLDVAVAVAPDRPRRAPACRRTGCPWGHVRRRGCGGSCRWVAPGPARRAGGPGRRSNRRDGPLCRTGSASRSGCCRPSRARAAPCRGSPDRPISGRARGRAR